MRARGVSAWLLEWQGPGPTDGGRVAAVLSARLAPSIVAAVVEACYANATLPFEERLRYASHKGTNLFPVHRVRQGRSGRAEVIRCGEGLVLVARVVRGLRVVRTADGGERLAWDERRDRPPGVSPAAPSTPVR